MTSLDLNTQNLLSKKLLTIPTNTPIAKLTKIHRSLGVSVKSKHSLNTIKFGIAEKSAPPMNLNHCCSLGCLVWSEKVKFRLPNQVTVAATMKAIALAAITGNTNNLIMINSTIVSAAKPIPPTNANFAIRTEITNLLGRADHQRLVITLIT